MKVLALAILTLLSLTACGLEPVIGLIPTHQQERVITGRYLAESDLAFLEKKHTTRDEVIKQLGPPTIWLQSQRIAVYGFVRFPGGKQPLNRPLKRAAVFIAFEPSDRVVDWGRSDVSEKLTWLGAALKWGRSSRLELAQPAQTFVETTPLPKQGVIYFYRPRDGGGASVFIEVYLDSALLGQVRSKSYLPLPLVPGIYHFQVSPNYPWSERWLGFRTHPYRIIPVTLRPGLACFVEIGIKQPATSQPFVAISPAFSGRSHSCASSSSGNLVADCLVVIYLWFQPALSPRTETDS